MIEKFAGAGLVVETGGGLTPEIDVGEAAVAPLMSESAIVTTIGLPFGSLNLLGKSGVEPVLSRTVTAPFTVAA